MGGLQQGDVEHHHAGRPPPRRRAACAMTALMAGWVMALRAASDSASAKASAASAARSMVPVGRQDAGAEPVHQGLVGGAPGHHHLAGDAIGVDEDRPPLHQELPHRRLPRPDPSGQPDGEHRRYLPGRFPATASSTRASRVPAAVASQVSSGGPAQRRPGPGGPAEPGRSTTVRSASANGVVGARGAAIAARPSTVAPPGRSRRPRRRRRGRRCATPRPACRTRPASLTVIPHPSRCEVLASTQARRYSAEELVVVHVPGKLEPLLGAQGAPVRLEARPLVALPHDHGAQVGDARGAPRPARP